LSTSPEISLIDDLLVKTYSVAILRNKKGPIALNCKGTIVLDPIPALPVSRRIPQYIQIPQIKILGQFVAF
jgi:hypothetical protein